MKTCLVAGGAGFIGSWLCKDLIQKGYRVICLDNMITGHRENIDTDSDNFSFIEHNIINPINIDEKIDFIFHLASPASPVHYQKHPLETLLVNSVGTMNLLKLAGKNKARFLFASSSEVYGDPKEHPQNETYWGNVNPNGPRACFSDDTEVLTETGWKLMKDITNKDRVVTLSDVGKIEYQEPIEIIKQRYIGELIAFKNYHCDILVTPNHNMYVKKRGKADFELISAYQAINWNRSHMLKVADYDAKEKEFFVFPQNIDRKNIKVPFVERIVMDDWLEFFGYFITEGCVYVRKRKRNINGKEYIVNEYKVLIAQSKKNKKNYDKIKACLTKMPFNFVDSFDHQFCITNKQLANYLKQFGKAHEKFVPQEFLNVSKRQLKILFDAMMLGDGSSKGTVYYSNSIKLISNFQELLLKIGYAGNIAVHDRRKMRQIYQIHILNRFNKRYRTPTYSKRSVQQYDGYVYCVTVPNHVVFVRRNGKALFCGNCYDEGKRFGEALVSSFSVDWRIVRIFNTYGPFMNKNDGRVVPNFINQALENKPITVYGDGKQTRSFCYVSDMIEGLQRAMFSDEAHKQVINLGNPSEITMLELADIVIELTGSKSNTVFKGIPVDDPTRRKPDITKAKNLLNWTPIVNIRDGMKSTIDYFRV